MSSSQNSYALNQIVNSKKLHSQTTLSARNQTVSQFTFPGDEITNQSPRQNSVSSSRSKRKIEKSPSRHSDVLDSCGNSRGNDAHGCSSSSNENSENNSSNNQDAESHAQKNSSSTITRKRLLPSSPTQKVKRKVRTEVVNEAESDEQCLTQPLNNSFNLNPEPKFPVPSRDVQQNRTIKDSISASHNEPVILKPNHNNEAKLQVNHVKSSVEKTLKKLYTLKMNELEIEIKLLEEGSLPEYKKKLVEMEAQKESNLIRIKNLLELVTASHQNRYEEGVKRAKESFDANIRNLKTQMMQNKTGQKWKLRQEFLSSSKYPNSRNEFLFDPQTSVRKRKAEAELSDLNRDCIPRHVGYIPEWTKSLLKRHGFSGEMTVIVPPYCTELKEYEKDEDVAFIRMCRS